MSFGYIPVEANGFKGKVKAKIFKALGWTTLIRRIQAPFLFSLLGLKKDSTVLDLGCGGGHFCYELSPFVKKVVGLDHSKFETHEAILNRRSNVEFNYSDAHRLPFHDETFDRVLLSSVFQVVDDDRSLASESARVLKNDGLVVASVPSDYCFIRKFYDRDGNLKFLQSHLPSTYSEFKKQIGQKFQVRGKQYYTDDEFRDLISPHFEIIKSKNSPGFLGSLIFEALLLFRFIKRRPSFTHRLDILFLPICFLDYLLPFNFGCEKIYLLRKRR